MASRLPPLQHLPRPSAAMDLRPLTLFLFAALFAVCHSCSTGTEFITGFITNYQQSKKKDHRLHLVLTAFDAGATVHIQVASLKFSKKLTLRAGETRWVSLPCEIELRRQFDNPASAVRISSSAEISVASFNRRFATGDGAVVSPIQNLGTEHYVYTPPGSKKYDGLVAVINGDSENTITIIPSKDTVLRGKERWRKGKVVTVTLKPNDSYLVRSRGCISGTQIKSTKPVAVLAGHQCVARGGRCEHVYEQLPPVAQMGKEYIVPFTGKCKARNNVIIVAGEDGCELTLTGTKPGKRILKKAGHKIEVAVHKKHPLVIESTKKVMVLLISNNLPHNPFMITLTPNHEMSTDWAVETMGDLKSFISIVSERAGAGSVEVCVEGQCLSKMQWNPIGRDKQWVWTDVALGRMRRHVTVEGDALMSVYVYGGKIRHGYGLAGICSGGSGGPAPPPKDPCDDITCRQKERCVNGKCQAVSLATCTAMGDPHYKTLDGRRYDFQGSCTYIMATVDKKAADLPDFMITTKNKHRGTRRVSFVRAVTVTVHSQTLTISNHRGRVEVNGEERYLPISLLGGKVKVTQSGGYAVIITDFNLVVKYDWNMRLIIQVPSSYYNHIGGLCGNYNGDKKDDLPEPQGKSIPMVLEMIKKWKVKDSDLFCHDNCGGHCPHCSLKQQKHYEKPRLCGLISKEDGPFEACHKHVHPSTFLEDCVYDVCVNKGARRVLCDNLKSYYDSCQSEGVNLTAEWREQSKCIPACPKGSHYEACGTACPASCSDPNSEKVCVALCVEGCQCNKGHVLSGDRCVPKSQCGCQYEGKYYPAGARFWADDKCTSRCKCVKGETKCKSVKCRKNEHCSLRKGLRDCYPASFASCHCSGDPHCRSLDNRRFDFQGTCTYILSQLARGSEQGLEPFQCLVTNENRGRNKAVAYTKAVSLNVFGNLTISMSRVNKRKILVNSRIENLPFSFNDGELTAHREGNFAVVKTSFGLVLRFDWRSHVRLSLPSSYAGETIGLCGNYNGNHNDDFTKSDGTLTNNVNEFGDSWKVGGDLGCTSKCPGGKCPECDPAMKILYRQRRYCGIISDMNGPFSMCHAKLDPTSFLNECVFDMCAYKGHASALCSSLSAFSQSCQDAGAEIKSWRTQKLCPPSCGPNSHYEICASPCQDTCSRLAPPDNCDESGPCTESCVCEDGFVLSNDQCVPTAECGCEDEGRYYQNGQVFYPDQSCNTQCTCSEGDIKCVDTFHCSEHETCVLKDGSASCEPRSVGFCSVSGVRAVRTFDGQEYPLWGNCLFTLSEVEQKDGGMPAYSVLVQQNTDKDGYVTRNVELRVYDVTITIETGVVGEVKVNDIKVCLPVSLADEKIRVNQNGHSIIMETDFGLKVSYDTMAAVVLSLPSTYHDAPRGLCGDYNNDMSDDLEEGKGKPQDMTAASVVKEDDEEVQCDTSCVAASCPDTDDQKVPDAEKDCDIIKALQGPFEGCHGTVAPKPYYDTCVREMATHKGGEDLLCRHIQNYVTVCQLASATIKEWRSDKLCPLKCPSGSHYELCGSSWSATCASLESQATSPPCQEGCQCDDDLMFDGADCVSVENCGCLVEGQYYKSGSTVLSDDCSEVCYCEAGQFGCKETSCKAGEECRNKNGVIGCFTTDPCAETRCRVKEHCEVSEGQGVCVPDSKALCWVFGDPHFTTFDGMSYSFQGTCSYVLVNTTGADSSLPEVTVTMKTELRGNSQGSFVRSVNVEILGYTIYIPSSPENIVMVDGLRVELPIVLNEGSLSITESGIRGTIETEIGVQITFDWSTLIMVTLSSSYFGNVGGLCGNYNGDKDDELTTSRGQMAGSVVAWAETWSIPDGDPFCYHECKGTCPDCSKEDQEKYVGPKFCGILSKKDGPFASCHGTLPVKEFVEDCLYDVCLNQGRQDVLCEALGNYMAECQEKKASVSAWRLQAGCPTPCPDHSHYKECGSACPATCGPEPEVCPKICVEGCFCDEGYVRSGKDCVKKESCGCSHEGKYYQPGQKFWGDSQCNDKCVCDTTTLKVQCTPAVCPAGERCGVKDGVQDCYPSSFKVCTARGDPHFSSFDGLKYDFQGNCLYRLVGMCGEKRENKELEQFEVTLENNNRGNSRVSYAKAVTLKFSDKTFILSQKYYGRVLVDDVKESLPFSWNRGQVQVYRSHRHAIIETHFLRVYFDFMSSVKVELTPHYQDAICGLCGNMNGDPSDDLTLPDGTKAVDANQFGVSQWVADTDGCSHMCKDCPPPLPPNFIPPSYAVVCDIITAGDGPLAECSRFLDSKAFHDDCVYDMFLNGGNKSVACDIISIYVEECQSRGGNVKPWRRENFCPMKCPDFSEYSLTAPGCPVSCNARSPPPRCKIPPAEGCVCKTGYLLSKDHCVKLPNCGCTYKDHYLEEGETLQTAQCRSSCKCLNGVVVCIKTRCKAKQKCAVVDGVRGCYSKKQYQILKKVEEEEEEEEEDEMKGPKDKRGKKQGKGKMVAEMMNHNG